MMELTLQFTDRYKAKVEDITDVQPQFREQLLTELESSGQQAIQEAHDQVEAAKQSSGTPQRPDDTGE